MSFENVSSADLDTPEEVKSLSFISVIRHGKETFFGKLKKTWPGQSGPAEPLSSSDFTDDWQLHFPLEIKKKKNDKLQMRSIGAFQIGCARLRLVKLASLQGLCDGNHAFK